MKEVTYEEWQKNPIPRMMLVWDGDKNRKVKRKVLYIFNEGAYPVLALDYYGTIPNNYRHCAEIEEPKTRRMTHKELSRWLRENPTREFKCLTSDYIYSTFDYREPKQDEEVSVDMRIREDDGEWREPLVEVKECIRL